MSATFSTFDQEVASGRTFSSERSRVAVVPAPPRPALQRPVAAPATVAPAVEFLLDNKPFAWSPLCLPGGLAHQASGVARLQGDNLSAEVTGLSGALPPNTGLWLWLLRDLVIPRDMDPRDLALLPHGPDGRGNQPGGIFTLDGTAPGIGAGVNTVALAVRAGELPFSESKTEMAGTIQNNLNLTFDPRVLLGQGGVADLSSALPSGLTDRILTDLFLRPATVLPELSIRTHFGQRLLALAQREIAALDRNGDGMVTLDEVGESPDLFLPSDQFNRAAVTLEPAAKLVPLMPTQTSCLLVGSRAGN